MQTSFTKGKVLLSLNELAKRKLVFICGISEDLIKHSQALPFVFDSSYVSHMVDVSQKQAVNFYGRHKELCINFSPYSCIANENLKFRMRAFVAVLAVLLLIHTTYAQDNGVSTTKKCEDVLAQNVRMISTF